MSTERNKGPVITIVTICALFGGYLDEPTTERLASITKSIWKAGRNKK
jgi:hypothetical protein